MMSSTDNQSNNDNPRLNIDEEISENFRQLERLANFYHQRGDYEKAHELTQAIESFHQQADERKRRESAQSANSQQELLKKQSDEKRQQAG